MRTSFVVMSDWVEAINKLPQKYQLETYKAMAEFGLTGEIPQNISPISQAVLTTFQTAMKSNIARYNASVENGKKGGRPPKNNPEKNLEKPSETQQNLEKPTQNLNVNVNDLYKVSKKESKKINILSNTHTHAHESYDEIFDKLGVSPGLKESYISFIRHCQANGHIVINDKLRDIIIRLDMAYGGDDTQKHISLQRAISGGYYDVSEGRL